MSNLIIWNNKNIIKYQMKWNSKLPKSWKRILKVVGLIWNWNYKVK